MPQPKTWDVIAPPHSIGLDPGLCRSNLLLCTFQQTMWAGLLLPNPAPPQPVPSKGCELFIICSRKQPKGGRGSSQRRWLTPSSFQSSVEMSFTLQLLS